MASFLSRMAKGLPFPLLLSSYLAWRVPREHSHRRRAMRRHSLPPLSDIDLSVHKTSDTVFLLGSGPSINQISPVRWQAIGAHDSIAVNFWLYHDFVPSLYLFEDFNEMEWPNLYRRFQLLMQHRGDAYKDVPKIITRLEVDGGRLLDGAPGTWRENLFAIHTLPVVARNPREFSSALRTLDRFGAFSRTSHPRWLCKYSSTLFSMLALALRMGYKRIVLCGVDLRQNDYFFQDSARYPEGAGFLQGPATAQNNAAGDWYWLVRAPEAIAAFREVLLEKYGVELYLESAASALSTTVPLAPAEILPAHEIAEQLAVGGRG